MSENKTFVLHWKDISGSNSQPHPDKVQTPHSQEGLWLNALFSGHGLQANACGLPKWWWWGQGMLKFELISTTKSGKISNSDIHPVPVIFFHEMLIANVAMVVMGDHQL